MHCLPDVHCCSFLQALPSLANKPDFLGKVQRLAFEVLDTLNGVNWRAGLDWVGLGPVAGAPLLESMMAHGHVNTLGLPIYVDQPRAPFTLGLAEFNAISMTGANLFIGRLVAQTELLSSGGCGRASAVQLELPALLWLTCWWRAQHSQSGSFVCLACLHVFTSCSAACCCARSFQEMYWDDAMVAHPDPFSVVAKAQLAQQVLTPPVMEAVLARFEEGRRLLGVASSLGLGCGGEGGVSGSSWFDLGLTHPQAVLGVLLLSQPNLPLAAYLPSAFAAAVGVSRGLVASFAAAPVRVQLPTKVRDGFEVVCDGRGGRDWPRHGSLTAVGAGDADGLRQQPLLLPALQARERECVAAALLVQGDSLAATGHRRGVFGRVRRVVGSVWRAVRRA